MLQRQQIAAARALLDWSRQDLSDRSGVSLRTISRFENGEGDVTVSKLAKMEDALTAAGITFVDGGVVYDRLVQGRRAPPV